MPVSRGGVDHWSLFHSLPSASTDDNADEEYQVIQVQGPTNELRSMSGRTDNLAEISQVRDIYRLIQLPQGEIEHFQRACDLHGANAENVKNHDPWWMCQNWVLEELDRLEEQGLLPGEVAEAEDSKADARALAFTEVKEKLRSVHWAT